MNRCVPTIGQKPLGAESLPRVAARRDAVLVTGGLLIDVMGGDALGELFAQRSYRSAGVGGTGINARPAARSVAVSV